MRATRLLAAALIALLLLAACGASTSTLGPLTIDPPDGWLVTDRQIGTIKVTNGTVGDGTAGRPGTATAVFDVYVDSAQSLAEYRTVLEDNNVAFDTEPLEIDGFDAVLVTSRASAFAPPQQTAFIGEWDVRIVYRAAKADAVAAFERYQPDFRKALRSIRFSGQPPA